MTAQENLTVYTSLATTTEATTFKDPTYKFQQLSRTWTIVKEFPGLRMTEKKNPQLSKTHGNLRKCHGCNGSFQLLINFTSPLSV